jgi:iron complex outermembrane receptor protein
MRQKIFLSALFLLFGFMQLMAQQRTITGHVTNSKDDSPIANASVLVGGEKKGVRTDNDGNFSINVSPDAKKLTVSYVGMLAQTVDISTQNNVTVSLATATEALSDVVIVGYGSVRKKDLTGAVSNIQAKDFNKGQINSPEQLLQGKVPGLQITNSSGQPGGITIVKIRGNNSIRTGNTPLYVVDGIPLDGRAPRPNFAPAGVGNTPGGDALTFINPNEIANIEVLKDASASAIYGSRGANGVIMITTKKGPSGPASVHVGASFGVSDIMRNIDVLDAAGYRAALNQFKAPKSDSGANVHPFDEIIRKSYTQNYSVALGGGGENGKYRASFYVSDQDGIILKTNRKKYVGNFNGQYKFLDNRLSVDFMTTVANVVEQIAPISQDAGSGGNLISLALIWNPTLSLKNRDGTFNQTNASGQVNPLALSKAYNDNTSITTILASGAAGYKITPWLEYKFLYGLNYGTGERKGELQGWIKGTGGIADGAGIAAVQQSVLNSQTMTHTLSFTRDVIHNLSINGLLGYEYWSTNLKGNGSSVYAFDYNLDQTKLNGLHYYDNMSDGKQGNLNSYSFKEPKVEIESYFARAIFNYLDKYLLTGTIRRDGSSKFGKNNKIAWFPSVAAAWNITKESFMEGMTFFNQLKLRAGYGETGNQEFPSDAALDVYRYNSYQNLGSAHFGNPDLKWETVKSIDIGLDYAFLNGKVYGAIDYFDKKTEDPIFLTVVSQPTLGGGSLYKNLAGADVTNKGFEFSVGADIVKTRDIGWSVNANFTTVKNKFNYPKAGPGPVAFTGALHGQGSSGAFSEAIADGQPVDVFFVPTFKGFDKNGIGVYSDAASYVDNPNPTSFMGFSTDVSYKKWSLNLGAHGAFGNKIFNNTAMSVLNLSNIIGGRNIASGLVTAGENVANAITPSTRYLEDGGYVKLHNATIKYTAGNIGKVVKNLAVYVSGNNLFVISKYKGFDPEVNVDKALNGIPSIGVDYIGYPTQRTFLIGFNFSL